MSIVKDARREGTVKYERHKPEQTLIYQIIEKYYPQFLTHMGQQDKGLPKHVWSEFEAYLKCGRLEYGFLRVRCEDCHHEHLVAFSWPLLRIPMRPRHLCILHVITQRVLIVVCQTERQCAANGKKRGE
jgi:hypothetical protein